jgi:hypothetical protein
LKNAGAAANGNYDFEFALFDALSAGTQIGVTLPRSTVNVTDGNFSVKLDFGSVFPGANRFLEIRVRTAGGGAFTTLSPRQPISNSPYSVKALSADNAAMATNATNALNAQNASTAVHATQLGGVAAGQYVLTGDVRLSVARPPLAGSANYIQNLNAASQSASNFNISGNGTVGGVVSANTVDAATQFNIGGGRVLSAAGSYNLFAGSESGINNTGDDNAFRCGRQRADRVFKCVRLLSF